MPRLIHKRKNGRHSSKRIIVFYHKDCLDGFSAAWAAWKKFGSKAEYIAVSPYAIPDNLKNKLIYILDNSCRQSVLKKLFQNKNKVTIIDHHLSSKKDVQSASEYFFNTKHSGAVLAWIFFHPKKAVPRMLNHVEDMDIWQFKIKNSREIFAGLDLFDFNFKIWDYLAKEIENPVKRKLFIEKGKFVLKYQNKLIEQIAQNAELVKFEGYRILAVNSPVLESELGHYLYERMPPMAIVWRRKNGIITVSLRSNEKIDVSKIAVKYGGGGHKGSSGFSLPADAKLPWQLIQKRYGW